jgi:hypothetical protein
MLFLLTIEKSYFDTSISNINSLYVAFIDLFFCSLSKTLHELQSLEKEMHLPKLEISGIA